MPKRWLFASIASAAGSHRFERDRSLRGTTSFPHPAARASKSETAAVSGGDTAGSTGNYRFWLLAATSGLYIGFGLVATSLAPVVSEISADLGLSISQMGVVLGAWQFVYLGAAVPAGRALDRIGLRFGLLLGIVLIAASGFGRAMATGWWSLIMAVGLFGVGGPLVSIGAPTLVSLWFRGPERGFATGLVTAGPVIGSIITLLSANSVLMPAFDGRWQLVVAAFAAGAALLGLFFLAVTARPPVAVSRPWARPVTGRRSMRGLLAVPLVRTVLVLAVLTFFVNHALGNWLPEMLRDLGLTPAGAGAWAAAIAVPGLISALTIPRLVPPTLRRTVLVTAYVLLAIAVLPLGWRWSVATAAGILVYGAIRSVVLPMAMLMLMEDEEVGAANMAGAGALYFTAGEIGGVTGPVVVGLVADRAGFGPAAVVLSVVSLAAAAVATGLGRGRRPNATSPCET